MKKLSILVFLCITLTAPQYAQQLTHVLGDLLVQVEPNTNIQSIERDLGYIDGQPTRLETVKNISKPFHIYKLHFDYTVIDENQMLAYVWRHPAVKVAQFNHLITERQTVPDDLDFSQQWHWVNDGSLGGLVDADVDAELAWDLTTGGQTQSGNHDIVVCVVEDGGADYTHEDLIDNHWTNEAEIPDDGIDNDNNGYIDDYNGWNPVQNNDNIPNESHGTQVSGMIGAVGNNAQGVVGMNWDVKIMQITYGGAQEASVIEAYTYPYIMRKRYNESGGTEGAFVVATNSSWGIDSGDPNSAPLWCSFYDTLGMVGILSCGATTNSNLDIDAVGDLPTACPSDFMVSVARTGIEDNHAGGYGLTHVDFGAPGIQVYTTDNGNDYSAVTGTSFASPLTAGVIALLYSSPCSAIGATAFTDPGGTALMIKDAIMEGTDPVPAMDGISVTGGRINAWNAMQLIMANCGPCPAPGATTVDNITTSTATVAWVSQDSSLSTTLRYREVGTMDWIEILMSDNPISLDGLSPCTSYELQLEDICVDTTSGFTSSVFFDTDGCCAAPENLVISNITDTTATATWEAITAANSYNLSINSSAGNTLIEDITDTSFDLTDLPPCDVINIAIQTVCDTGITAFSPFITFETFGCGVCTDFDYCEIDGNTQYEFIESVEINAYTNISGDNEGYGFFESSDIELATYGIYDVTIEPGFNGNGFGQNVGIWMDVNQNGEFDQDGELLYQSDETFTETTTFQIAIPADAVLGNTRLRIIQGWGGNGGGFLAEVCNEDVFSGEAEDYCVNIVEGQPLPCEAPTDLEALEITPSSAELFWTTQSNASGYLIQYRPIGSMTWESIDLAVNQSNIPIGNLIDCTDYEFQVATNCLDGSQSAFSVIATFTTQCLPDCSEIPTDLQVANITNTTADLSWSVTANAVAYAVRYKNVEAMLWEEMMTTTSSSQVIELDSCETFEFQVKTLCEFDLESAWSPSTTFDTDCFVSTNEENLGVADIQLFPNPFNDQFQLTFQVNNAEAVIFELLDAVGRVVVSENIQLTNGTHTWQPTISSTLPNGVYFVRMSNEKGWVTRKLLKH